MLIRNCAGGLVFRGDQVLLVRDEKGNWGFPKGVVKANELSHEAALERVREVTGSSVKIISAAGLTHYEVHNVTKARPVCDKTIWYIMESLEGSPGTHNGGLTDEGFFNLNEAMNIISHSQDRALLSFGCDKYRKLMAPEAV